MDDDQPFAQFQPHRDRFAAADAADDLARRDQLCGMLVQYTNFRHGFHLPLVFVQCIFQLVQEVQRLQRGQCLNVYIVEFFDDLAGYAGVL